jgi:hypothetical protein
MGITFSFNVPQTAHQPGNSGIIGAPQSGYAHIVSLDAFNSGVFCSSYWAADGFCVPNEYYFASMDDDISTIGYDSVELSFWWLCSGGPDSYGELYFSTDGGTTWVRDSIILNYNNSSSWTKLTVSNSQFSQQGTLRIGYRFVNEITNFGSDPAFAIDEVTITGYMTTGVEEFSQPEVTIYPNPASDHFFIYTDLSWELTGWDLTGTDGRVVLGGSNERRIELVNLDAGLYILRMRFSDQILSRKILVESSR